MATLILHKDFKDRYGLAKEIMSFMQKLTNDPTNPSLHIEPLKSSADKRVRTGRINHKYRAVMFEIHGSGEPHFLLLDVLNHDDAYELAARATMKINPITGVTELHTGSKDRSEEEIEARAKALAAQKIAELAAQEAEQVAAEVAAAPPTPADVLTRQGIVESTLTDELGFSPLSARAVFTAGSESALADSLADCPEWELDAVIGLLAGLSVADVRDELGLKMVTNDNSDDALIDGLKTPIAQRKFVFAPGEEELQEILESGDFDAWRIFLHPSQRTAVTANHSGSARIQGGAGTGKTVVVIHRTNHLLEQNPGSRVLLTTFTRELANSLKSQMNLLNPSYEEASTHGAPGLWISGIDALVQRVIENAQISELTAAFKNVLGLRSNIRPKALDGFNETHLWEDAALIAGGNLASEKAHPTFLSQEYSTVILTHGITTEKDYLRVSRAGRGTPLTRAERKLVWAIVDAFHSKCLAEGRFTFPAISALAAGVLTERGGSLFDHVLIDEAQDFHAGHWRFLRACVAPGPNDIFLAEDSHQRIYGQRLVLSRYGIITRGRASRRLLVNYRTTAENLAYASAILDGVEWFSSDDSLDSLQGYRSVRHGPDHIILHSDSQQEEAAQLASLISNWGSASVGILTRTRKRCDTIAAQLAEHGISVSQHRGWSPGVSVMTMFNAKGLEFTHVILLDVNKDALPQRYLMRGLAEAECQDALQRERALLYVAASRARDQLVVSVVGEPSTLLPET